MKRLFLASSVSGVALRIARDIGAKVRGMRLAFIITAAEAEEGNKGWLRDDRAAVVKAGFDVFDYTLTGKTSEQIRKDLSHVDVVFIEGGNPFYLLQQIQQSGFAPIVRELIKKGVIYIGSSAGSQVAGPDLYPVYRTDRVLKAPDLNGYEGLGLVDFLILPHWGNNERKEDFIHRRLEQAYTTNHKIILLSDNQYIRVEGEMYRIEEATN